MNCTPPYKLWFICVINCDNELYLEEDAEREDVSRDVETD
jgi:hypothetical protein